MIVCAWCGLAGEPVRTVPGPLDGGTAPLGRLEVVQGCAYSRESTMPGLGGYCAAFTGLCCSACHPDPATPTPGGSGRLTDLADEGQNWLMA